MLRRIVLCAVVCALWVGSPQTAFSALRYVGQAASGSGTGTSVSNLCGGVTDTDCTPSAGDTVYLCGAFTSTQVVQAVNGTAGNPITYDGACPGGVAMAMAYDGATDRGFYINGRSWLTVQNMTFSGETTCNEAPCALFATLSSTDLTITNITASGNQYDCLFIRSTARAVLTNITAHDCGTSGRSYSGIHISNTSSDVTLDEFLTYNNVWAGVFVEGFGAQTSLQRVTVSNGETYTNGSGLYIKLAMDVLVDNVHAYNNANAIGSGEHYGIGVQQSNGVTIQNCHIHDNLLHGIEYYGEAAIGAHNGVIRSNVIHDNGNTGGQRAGIVTKTGYSEQLLIYGNVIYNHERGIQLAVDATGRSLIAHNTLYGNAIDLEYFDSSIPGVDPVTGWIIANNIFAPSSHWFYEAIAGASSTPFFNNAFVGNKAGLMNGTTYTPASVTTLDTTALTSDPAFVGVESDDFRLAAASLMRRAGISGSPCADARGRVCYPDSPDIGAYQSSSGDPAATRAVRN